MIKLSMMDFHRSTGQQGKQHRLRRHDRTFGTSGRERVTATYLFAGYSDLIKFSLASFFDACRIASKCFVKISFVSESA